MRVGPDVDKLKLRKPVEERNTTRENIQCLLISRLDSDKEPGIKGFLSEMSKLKNCYKERGGVFPFEISIAGDGCCRNGLEEYVSQLELSNYVSFLGKIEEAYKIMGRFDLIIGMGRVLLEAMCQQKEFLSINYSGPVGLVDFSLLKVISYSNFSARNLKTISLLTLADSLKKHKDDNIDWERIGEFLSNHYNFNVIWEKYLDIINSKKKVLMAQDKYLINMFIEVLRNRGNNI